MKWWIRRHFDVELKVTIDNSVNKQTAAQPDWRNRTLATKNLVGKWQILEDAKWHAGAEKCINVLGAAKQDVRYLKYSQKWIVANKCW